MGKGALYSMLLERRSGLFQLRVVSTLHFLMEYSVQITLLGMGPSSFSYRLKAASTMPRLGSSP